MRGYHKRNPAGAPAIAGYTPKNPAEAAEVAELAKEYTDWHWSKPAKRVIRVADKMVPNIVAIGQLEQFDVDGETYDFPKGSWIGFDPKHPHERIHVVIPPALREKLRKSMKTQRNTVSLQSIAESTGGTQAKYKLPNLQAVDLGTINSVTYCCEKGGDGWSSYIHEFGQEHSNGVQPKLAVDVSGRMWIAGGSHFSPLAGITG